MKTHEVKRQGDRGQRTKSPLTGEESGLMHHVKSKKASAGKGVFQRLVRVEPIGSWAWVPPVGEDRGRLKRFTRSESPQSHHPRLAALSVVIAAPRSRKEKSPSRGPLVRGQDGQGIRGIALPLFPALFGPGQSCTWTDEKPSWRQTRRAASTVLKQRS